MSRGALFWLLIVAAVAAAVYVIYAYRNVSEGPDLSEALGVIISVIGLGGAVRMYYLVLAEPPAGLANDDLVCMFVGAVAVTWCSVTAGLKPFINGKNGPVT